MTSYEKPRCAAGDDEAVQAALGAVLSGDYTPAELKTANRHLAACAACREEYGELAAFRKRLTVRYDAAEARPSAFRRPASGRRWTWGGLALAASLLVGVAVWQAAPDSRVLIAAPGASPGVEGAGVAPNAVDPAAGEGLVLAAGTPAGTGTGDELELDMGEISDAELDEILYELGY